MKIKTLDISKTNFNKDLNDYLKLKVKNSKIVETSVSIILEDIKRNKDKALIKLSKRFDKSTYKNISESVVSKDEISEAYSHISKQTLTSLKKVNFKEIDISAENIRSSLASIRGINQKFDIEEILDIIFSDFCIGK